MKKPKIRYRREYILNLTRRHTKELFKLYPLLKVYLRNYENQRLAIMEACGTSVVSVVGKRKSSNNPTLQKVVQLNLLEQRYRLALTITQAIDALLAARDKETRKVLKLYFFEGYSMREIAEKVNYSRKTVERRISNAINSLASLLAQEADLILSSGLVS